MQYNFLYRHNEPAIARAAARGLGVAIMGPIAGGRLAIPQGVLRAADGTRTARTPELALRYVWSNPNVSVALSGMNTLEQIEENAAIADQMVSMSAAEMAEVNRLAEENRRLEDLYCTGCGYCQPCPNGVNIPENFRYMNWHRVWGLTECGAQGLRRPGARGLVGSLGGPHHRAAGFGVPGVRRMRAQVSAEHPDYGPIEGRGEDAGGGVSGAASPEGPGAATEYTEWHGGAGCRGGACPPGSVASSSGRPSHGQLELRLLPATLATNGPWNQGTEVRLEPGPLGVALWDLTLNLAPCPGNG